ncbi:MULTISPECIES: HNH endonuclease signature motif containing protein [Burkholderia]|uniref:HNH endonuclease signature motif containing protein n=1 Tax=Burkholderia TaxID=32008 RepID=UPI000B2D1CDF|nr:MULTISPECIES: HNH endonuclease signature motif containing protein [Burkholderia]
MSHVFNVEDFIHLNSFYSNPQCRRVVRDLYKSKCKSCDEEIVGDDYHVAHIISRSHPELMEKYLPGLDVDNLLNLKLSCPTCNLKESNFVLDTPILTHNFNVSAKAISLRLKSILEKLNSNEKQIAISSVDSKICTTILHIEIDEIRRNSSDWHGALAIPQRYLDDRTRTAMAQAFGADAHGFSLYETLAEALHYLNDSVQVNGTTYSCRGKRKPAWWVKAHSHLWSETRGRQSIEDAIRSAGLTDIVLLDPDELSERQGLWIPLRNESQRWFYDVIGTIIRTNRKIDRQRSKRYVVLAENEWYWLNDCFDRLTYVEAGIGVSTPRLKAPEAFVHFTSDKGKLHIHDEGQNVPDEIKEICRSASEASVWCDGTVMRTGKLKSWLARAFDLAELGACKVTGPDLIRIGDIQTQWKWVPPLPRLKGKTREQIRNEYDANYASKSRRKKYSNAS